MRVDSPDYPDAVVYATSVRIRYAHAKLRGDMMELSAAQEEAMKKLTNEWQSSYALQVGRNTLDALVRKGLVQVKSGLGSLFSPSTAIKYRLTNL